MSGPKLPSVKKVDGDITVSRTIQTPSGSIVITGTLTEADRIYRLLAKSLLQNGYKLTHLTKMATALPGEVLESNEMVALHATIDRLTDESMEIIRENRALIGQVEARDSEIAQLHKIQTALEDTLSRVTSRPD